MMTIDDKVAPSDEHSGAMVDLTNNKRIFLFTRVLYRVVKQNCQVVRFRDFEHMRARMAQFFFKTSRHNIYLLIQSKKLRSKAKTSPES